MEGLRVISCQMTQFVLTFDITTPQIFLKFCTLEILLKIRKCANSGSQIMYGFLSY